MAITKRLVKGSALTHIELDGNFTDLDTRVGTLEAAVDSDGQTLSLVGNDLTISGGNTVSLSTLGVGLTSFSATTAAAGTQDLEYNNITGVFTFTPLDTTAISITKSQISDLGVVLTNITAESIGDLSDVDTTTTPPAAGQVLKWDAPDSKWKPATDSAGQAAQTAAEVAQVAAEVAQVAAEVAQVAAETAETNAVAAQSGVQAAQAGAVAAQTLAETARDAAAVNADVYADTAAGLAATSVSDQFVVTVGDELVRYRHDTGPVAVEVARYPSSSYVNSPYVARYFIEFVTGGSYISNGTVGGYGGRNYLFTVEKTGLYKITWDTQGGVRYIHAEDANGTILASWGGDVTFVDPFIFVPEGTVTLKLSAYDLGAGYSNYLELHEVRADGATRGVTSEDEITAIADARSLIAVQAAALRDDEAVFAYENEVDHFDMVGNLWSDGTFKNASPSNSFSKTRCYTISDTETYMFHYDPKNNYSQAISNLEIVEHLPLTTNQNFGAITHNGTTLNNLGADCDTVTVNSYTTPVGKWSSTWTPPAGAKRLLVSCMDGSVIDDGIRLFKTDGRAALSLAGNPNSGKSIVIMGDSVAQSWKAERSKSRLRGMLGSKFDTYAMGGSGWAITATPTWVTPNNISGVYQVNELAQPAAETYDIYLLSATLNDPITHQSAIGTIDMCVPYVVDGSGNPDLTDSDLDTMLGALNFAIQRIYDKNPNAKIVIGTMNKAFLTSITSGFGLAAGHDPDDTTTNSHGSTYYEYVQAVRSLGDKWGIPVADIYGKSNINQLNKAETMSDQYHPTVEGYRRMWAVWADAIMNA